MPDTLMLAHRSTSPRSLPVSGCLLYPYRLYPEVGGLLSYGVT